MNKRVVTLLVIILMAFIVVEQPSKNLVKGPYYDIVFLCGFNDDYLFCYDIFNDRLQEIAYSLNLSYFNYRGFDLPNVRTNMLILLAHGNLDCTRIGSSVFSNKELFDWFEWIEVNYFISESCFSGRFFSLPPSISVLASSNGTESFFRFSFDVDENDVISNYNFNWGFLPFFIDHFNFNLTSAYLDIVSSHEGLYNRTNQTIWTRTNNEVLSTCLG